MGLIEWVIATVAFSSVVALVAAYWVVDRELETLTHRVKELEKEIYLLDLDRRVDELRQEPWL